MHRLAQSLSAGAYIGGWRVVRALPDRVAYPIFRKLADAATLKGGPGVGRLEANLRRALPVDATDDQVAATVREAMRRYFQYWADAFLLPDWDERRVVDTVDVVGEVNLRAPLAAGRGVVAALPHMGNWDHAGAWASLTGAPVTTVAERLEPESVYQAFVDFRERLGMEILPLTGGDVDVFETLAQRLQAGGFVCLLADRDLTARGIPVTLLGEPAGMPAGPAALALRTGAALLPITLWAEGAGPSHRLGLQIHPEVPPSDVAAMTQAVADAFSEGIRAHPADWHMLQALFTADLDPERVARSHQSTEE